MAFIIQRIVDYRVQLGREELIRPMVFGSNWAALRIALLCTVNGWGTLNTPGPTTGLPFLALGVCQGSVGISGDTTIDAIFVSPGVSFTTTQQLVYTTSGAINYYTSGAAGGCIALQKLGGTVTTLSSSSASTGFLGAISGNYPSTYARQPLVLDIIKGSISAPSTNYTFNLYAPASVGQLSTGDVSKDTFFDRIQTFGAITNTTIFGAVTSAVSGNMLQDNAFVFWNHSTPTLEVAALAVIRFG